VLLQALFGGAFNPARTDWPRPDVAAALDWAARAALPVAALENPVVNVTISGRSASR
jgi:hypothetical protein